MSTLKSFSNRIFYYKLTCHKKQKKLIIFYLSQAEQGQDAYQRPARDRLRLLGDPDQGGGPLHAAEAAQAAHRRPGESKRVLQRRTQGGLFGIKTFLKIGFFKLCFCHFMTEVQVTEKL